MSNAVHSHTDTLTSSTKTRMVTTVLSRRLSAAPTKLDSLLQQARIFQNLQSLVLSMATPRPTPTRFVFGRPNSVTSLTVLRLSSTNSWLQVKQSGTSRTVLFCYCLMDSTVRDPNTQVPASKDSYSCPTRPTRQC
jgi:hypothetical protein